MKTKIAVIIVALILSLLNKGTAQTTNVPVTLNMTRIPAYVISFQSVLGINYVVQTNQTLTSSNWHNLACISGTGSLVSYTNFPDPSLVSLNYRVYGVESTNTTGFGTTNTDDIANISLDGSSTNTSPVVVTNTIQGQYLQLPIMVFDIAAEGDTLHLHDISVNITNNGGGIIGAAYLYQGSTQISSASVVNGVATFQNISDGTPGASIPVNTTVPFTVKVDVSGLTTGVSPAVITASASAATIYNSVDATAITTGVAVGNPQTVFGTGPVFSLARTPEIQKSIDTSSNPTNQIFHYTATFNVNVTAVGENVNFGLPSDGANSAFGGISTGTAFAQLYVNGVPAVNQDGLQVTAYYTTPTNITTTESPAGLEYFTLAQNQSITIPVTYTWIIINPKANTYALQLQGIQWFTSSDGSNSTVSNFMANNSTWRTISE